MCWRHSPLAKLLACNKLNVRCVFVYKASQLCNLARKERGATGKLSAPAVGARGDGRWVRQQITVCPSAASGLSTGKQDPCSAGRWGWSFPEAPWGAGESGLGSYKLNLRWLCSQYASVGRGWGLAPNSHGLCCSLATPQSPSECSRSLQLYWANRMVVSCLHKPQHRKWVFKVDVPLVLLCLLCVCDLFMGRSTVLFPGLTGDFNFLQSTSLDLI